MRKSNFDVFCPVCNVLVEARAIAGGNGGYRSDAINPLDGADAEYYGEHYSVCLCPRCSKPFLIRQSLYGIPGEFETITEETLLYPTESKLLPEALPDSVKTAYDQAVKSLNASLFEPCVLMCRKCLEAVCKTLGVQGRGLNKLLSRLSETGQIDSRLLNWAHEIRLVGNEAAHDIETPVTKENARDVLDFTEAILIYIFSLTKRFESFRARRMQGQGDVKK